MDEDRVTGIWNGRRISIKKEWNGHTWTSGELKSLFAGEKITVYKNRPEYYHLICRHCKKEFISYGNKERKYCSHNCYIRERFGGDKNEKQIM